MDRRDGVCLWRRVVTGVTGVVVVACVGVRGAALEDSNSILENDSAGRDRRVESTATRGVLRAAAAPPTTTTWGAVVREIVDACAEDTDPPGGRTNSSRSGSPGACVETALTDAVLRPSGVMESVHVMRDGGTMMCAAREATRMAPSEGGTPSEGSQEREATAKSVLLKSCCAVAETIGRAAIEAGGGFAQCGEVASVACDGCCVRGVLFQTLDELKGATARALTAQGASASCVKTDMDLRTTCARALGFVAERLSSDTARDGWEACLDVSASIGKSDGVRACRFGVVEAYVDHALTRGDEVKEICDSDTILGEIEVTDRNRVAEVCADALGVALLVKNEYDAVSAREACDLISATLVKQRCVTAVNEESKQREIDIAAAVSWCTQALKTPLGEAGPVSASPPPSPPPPPVDRSQEDERKEALRRHGSGVGGALWLVCFTIVLTIVVACTVYLWWRNGGGNPFNPPIQYRRVAATELASL